MNQLYEHCCPEDTKTATGCSSFIVGYNLLLLDKELTIDETRFYAEECMQKGWSRDILLNSIKMNTYAIRQHQVKSNNFDVALPEAQADKSDTKNYLQVQTQNPAKHPNRCFRTIWEEREIGLIRPDRESKECFLPLLNIFSYSILLVNSEL